MTGWMDILKKIHVVLLQQYREGAEVQDINKLLSALALSNYFVKTLSGENPDLKTILALSELKKSVLIYTPETFTPESDDTWKEVTMPEHSESHLQETNKTLDFRLISLALKNFRKYPDGRLYGLRFHAEDQIPRSLILVGRNSHGKSSLYDAMEFIFTGNVSEAKLRNVECSRFIAHGDTNLTPTIQARLVGTKKTVTSFAEFQKMNPLSVRCCFCSEADTIDIGKREGSDRSVNGLDFFAENLGYGILVDLKKGLAKVMHEEDGVYQNHTDDIANASKAADSAREDLAIFVESLFSLWDKNSENGDSIMAIRRKIYKKVLAAIENKDITFHDVSNILDNFYEEINAYSDSSDFPVNKDFLENTYSRFSNELFNLRNRTSDTFSKFIIPVVAQDIRPELRKILFSLKVFIKRLTPYQFIDKGIVNELEYKLQVQKEKEDILHNCEEQFLSSRRFCGWKLYCQTLDNVLCSTLNDERMSILKPFIEETMKMFISTDRDEVVEITERLDIELKYREHGEMITISPKRFYNTFRYKLFCMMLQVSTSVCFMKMHNFIFPVILDDIFYASDFGSRMLIRDFIVHFIQMYEKTIGTGRLQLICFTHDEIVLSAIYEALVKIEKSKINHRMNEFTFGRLVDYQALEPQGCSFTNLYMELFKN